MGYMMISSFYRKSLLIVLLTGLIVSEPSFGQKIKDQILWKAGTGNYKNYRIPSIMVTQKGSILAFCEGREGGDSGDIDILLKRSENNGKLWSKEVVIWNDGQNTCGNPCVVEDTETGRIWLVMTWNNGKDSENGIITKESAESRIPYICYSDNDGLTWSVPEKMSAECKDPSWGWYATGPGIGIQLRNGKYIGRLVIPANHSYDDPAGKILNKPFSYGSHVLYSDDHGKKWKRSQSIKPGCNESQVVELADGTLLMNIRSYNGKYCRAISISNDGGESWSEIHHDAQLADPVCQASLLEYGIHGVKTIYLFANPAVTNGRNHMTIRVSDDNCSSWSNSKLIFAGPSAYSSLAKLSSRRAAIFFECGQNSAYEALRFISFPINELFRPGSLISDK
jgi:sialidase-1